jgi:hypothetical protein
MMPPRRHAKTRSPGSMQLDWSKLPIGGSPHRGVTSFPPHLPPAARSGTPGPGAGSSVRVQRLMPRTSAAGRNNP